MEDGQFVGGGSVEWEVNNTDGDSGGGDKKKCKGKDKDPKGSQPDLHRVRDRPSTRSLPIFPERPSM